MGRPGGPDQHQSSRQQWKQSEGHRLVFRTHNTLELIESRAR